MQELSHELLEQVLTKLGFSGFPVASASTLQAIYHAWCQRVPFDNARKLMTLREGHSGRLPGDNAEDFYQAWLKHGCGGTCWAGNGALCALLQNLGFDAGHGVATMMVVPDLPPNHGTVWVRLDGARYLVDASILYDVPLVLEQGLNSKVEHPAWGVKCRPHGDTWVIEWRPHMRPKGLDCRIDSLGATLEEFMAFHEATRAWGPFNYELSVRSNRGDMVYGIAMGKWIEIGPRGEITESPLTADDRLARLVDTLQYSEEFASRIPADIPTPPPPGSNTAAAASHRT